VFVRKDGLYIGNLVGTIEICQTPLFWSAARGPGAACIVLECQPNPHLVLAGDEYT